MSLSDLVADQKANPSHYTVWFLHYMRDHGAAIAEWMQKPVAVEIIQPAP